LEKADAFWKLFLLKSDGTQDRAGCSASSWIGKSQAGLPICVLQPPLLDQRNRPLKSFARISSQLGGCTQKED
ncbi:MAG TPA: hypothetical protein VK579_14375, partial [Terriglobales bacterium]|nr:hypothetical protein [Terriglobales bacterium]